MSTATTLTQKGHAGTERKALTLAFTLLALLAALSYANSLHNDFAFDDNRVILRNPILRRLDQIPALFTTGSWMPDDAGTLKGRVFRPLVLSSFAISYAVAGYDPFSYRLSNVGLRILVTWGYFWPHPRDRS